MLLCGECGKCGKCGKCGSVALDTRVRTQSAVKRTWAKLLSAEFVIFKTWQTPSEQQVFIFCLLPSASSHFSAFDSVTGLMDTETWSAYTHSRQHNLHLRSAFSGELQWIFQPFELTSSPLVCRFYGPITQPIGRCKSNILSHAIRASTSAKSTPSPKCRSPIPSMLWVSTVKGSV